MTPSSLPTRIRNLPRELALFIIASFAVGMAASLVDSSLNNFLNDTFSLNGFQRSFLEFPREFPGVITLFLSAALWFLGRDRRAAHRSRSRWPPRRPARRQRRASRGFG